MRLRSIKLKNFKRFDDFQAQFSPGVNVVKGSSNEIGKSTLLEGIIAALFYNPKSTAKDLEGYISWGSTRRYETSLEFEEEGNRYLAEKDFEKGVVRLVSYAIGEELDTYKKISERVGELLGTTSDSLFLSTSCIRQDEVREISSGKKVISDSLEEIVTGGKENVLASHVIEKLHKKLSEIKKGLGGTAKFPGRLASFKKDIDGILQRRKEVDEEVSKLEARKIALVEIDKELAHVKEEYESSKALLEKNKQRKDIKASIEKLTQDYNQADKLLREINSLAADSERANEALAAIEGLENGQQVSEFRRGLGRIRIRHDDIEKHLAEREKEAFEARKELDKRRLIKRLGSRQFIIFSAIISVTIVGLAILVIAMWAKGILAQEKTKIADLKERIQKMKDSLGELDKEEKDLLAKAGCSTVGEFDDKEKNFGHWLGEKKRAEDQLMWMLRGRTIEEIEEQRQETARNLAVEQAKLTEDLKATALSPEEYIELEAKVARLERKQVELNETKRDCEAAIKWARFDAEDQVRLEEELESIQESLRREEYRVKVYELAREFISEARAEVFLSATETLEKEIQKHLAVFTNGKYDQVKVNKENLEFWTYSKEKGDWVKPEKLSGGVIDEFYLASRLALMKLIFGDKKPPLILDDPFSNFDTVRLSRTLDFFKKFGEEYQIIIFTLKDSYDEIADNVILLD